MKVTETGEGVVIEIFVRPRSRDFKIVIETDEIVVFCREEPIRGKANKEILKKFSKLFHKKAEIVTGSSAGQKRLLIRDIRKDEVERVLLNK